MFPVLFSIGNITVSSFGVFLTFGFLYGVFLVWRLTRAWGMDEEKILDLTLLTFIGGLLGARVYFVIENLQFFINSPLNILLFTKYPGFSFWGAFLGGWLTLYFFARRKRVDFLRLADIASVGFIGGLALSNIGCFLGGCGIGIQSSLFFAVNMVGQIGKRFPTQILEALLLLILLKIIWSKATHFHQRGKIVSLSLIYIGLIKLITEPLKANHNEGFILSFVLFVLGITLFYKATKRNIIEDIKGFFTSVGKFLISSNSRRIILVRVQKYWYNQTTTLAWKIRNIKKNLRRLNVKFSYKNNKLY